MKISGGRDMTSRERVLKALNFEEADRIPVDWGNNAVTGIQADAYRNLLKYIGHEEGYQAGAGAGQ